jgi:two-component system, OmpR family, sensor histidine kinase CreC
VRIRTAIFTVYVAVAGAGFVLLLALVLRDVRLRYVESMRRTLTDTAVLLAAQAGGAGDNWTRGVTSLPDGGGRLRVFATDPAGRVVFDAGGGRDVGAIYHWPPDGAGGPAVAAVVGDELRVRAPVVQGERVVGWMGVGRRLTTVVEGIARARWRLVFLALGVAAGMATAGWWVAARLTRSLERLTRHVEDVGRERPTLPPRSRATEIQALVGAFERMRESLAEKASVERYTEALAHQVKAPLSGIRGAAELLQEEDLPPEDRARFLGNLRAEADRLQRIVDRLLELASLEALRRPSAPEAVDLATLTAEVAGGFAAMAEARGVTIRIRVNGPVLVRGQAALLRDALGNLVQNAVEFSPRGGEVEVSAVREAGAVRLRVEDRGPGIPDYATERVFERFYSLPRPETGRKSSGLGLSLVREIARLHRGEIALTNREGGGARAVLTLPEG